MLLHLNLQSFKGLFRHPESINLVSLQTWEKVLTDLIKSSRMYILFVQHKPN